MCRVWREIYCNRCYAKNSGPKGFEQEPFLVHAQWRYKLRTQITHWESPHNQDAGYLTLNCHKILPALKYCKLCCTWIDLLKENNVSFCFIHQHFQESFFYILHKALTRKKQHLYSIFKVYGCVLSHVWLFVTPGTLTHQVPLSMGFSQQEYWSGLQCPPPEWYVLSGVWIFVTPWTLTHQAPLSIGFSQQEYWSGLRCPPPEHLANLTQESNLCLLRFLHSRRILYHWATKEASKVYILILNKCDMI